MNCADILKKLSAYSDGELDTREAEAVSVHIKNCPVCLKELNLILSLKNSIADTRPEFLNNLVKLSASQKSDLNLWPLVKAKLAQPEKTLPITTTSEDIFEKYIYKLSLAGAMLLYLLTDFDPVTTTLFWFYFLYHLVVYSQKFDARQTFIRI